MRKIVIFNPYPQGEAPSQRFRYEQYLNILQGQGFKITLFSFYNQSTWKKLYSKPPAWQFLQLIKGLVIALLRIPLAANANYIFIHREVAPLGPPMVEWLLAKVFRKRIIYDFDDAIWLTDKTEESWFEAKIRWRSKVRLICKWSYKVSCGNTYLCDYARQFNSNVVLNPTTIDTEAVHNIALHQRGGAHFSSSDERVVIGWTGSHTTLKYLEMLNSVLQSIEKKYTNISFLVIADKVPQLSLTRMEFRKWSKETEIADLAKMNIGIMPLPDDEWTKGKCGFKALQYMAMGIPALVSPVAINKVIVEDGENGFWCNDDKDWITKLSQLIENKTLRNEMGEKGKIFVNQHYSIKANSKNFLSLFS